MNLYIGPALRGLIDLALEEDQVGFDVTSAAFFDSRDRGEAHLVARQDFQMAGGPVARAVFERVDSAIRWRAEVDDGQAVESGEVIAVVRGPVGSLLGAERVALNFLQRLCGVATLTRAYVDALGEGPTEVVDTRKTLPGWRMLDKYAVRCGGAKNHRFNLGGGVMIKENHIAAAGGIAQAIDAVSQAAPHTLRIEVEVERLDQITEAIEGGADIIMLDNMDNDTMRRAIEEIRAHRRGDDIVIEGSGNIDRKRLATLGDLGLDVVSAGALTHSAPAADISMRLQERGDQ